MSKSLIKTITTNLKTLPKTYNHTIQPLIQSTINISIIQPLKSLIRFHHLKKSYNTKYRYFISFSKAFLAVYLFMNYVQYDIGSASLIGMEVQQTEYYTLVKKACQDNAGIDMISHHAVQVINKGKQSGLLAIQLNQLAYLLQPAEIAWQGRYLASLKA